MVAVLPRVTCLGMVLISSSVILVNRGVEETLTCLCCAPFVPTVMKGGGTSIFLASTSVLCATSLALCQCRKLATRVWRQFGRKGARVGVGETLGWMSQSETFILKTLYQQQSMVMEASCSDTGALTRNFLYHLT